MARTYNYEMKPGESLERYYRRIAKVADQRLVRLERLEGTDGYGNANQWAYKRAISDIENWSGEGATRFNTKAPSSKRQIQAKINDIKAFLGAESSTKSGIDRIYKKRVATINKNFDTDFTVDQFKKLVETSFWKKIDTKDFGGSDTVFQAIAAIKEGTKDDKELLSNIKDQLEAQEKLDTSLPIFTGDRFVDNTIKEMLKDSETIDEMYNFFKMI